jgi:catechol 2,3-dioxygenase-like lactoylglutathione lyase family enzyme
MKIKALGHVVLRVTDCARAEQFYNGVLGLPVCARFDQDGMKMSFFTLGNHHDFAVMEVSGEGGVPSPSAVGLHHVAFRIDGGLDELRQAKAKLEVPASNRPRSTTRSPNRSISQTRMATAWRSTSMRRRPGVRNRSASPSSLPWRSSRQA